MTKDYEHKVQPYDPLVCGPTVVYAQGVDLVVHHLSTHDYGAHELRGSYSFEFEMDPSITQTDLDEFRHTYISPFMLSDSCGQAWTPANSQVPFFNPSEPQTVIELAQTEPWTDRFLKGLLNTVSARVLMACVPPSDAAH